MAGSTALGLDLLIDAVDRRRPADALDRITVAEDVVAELARLGERLVGFYVEQARNEGRSWADIGAHVGVTRQAAQQRFTGRWSTLTVADLEQAGAFERVTDRAREALRRSERHARDAGHDAITVEHLLRAVLDDRSALAARALEVMAVDIRAVEEAIAGDPPATTGGSQRGGPASIPVSPAARRCLARAAEEALALGHNYVGTEHLLLAALGDESLSGRLEACGLVRERARATIADLLDAYLRARE